jgi:hypothetical protein
MAMEGSITREKSRRNILILLKNVKARILEFGEIV